MEKFENPLRVEKKQRVPTYNLTQEQIDHIREEARREGIPTAICVCNSMYSAAMLIALRDQFGFGKDRLTKAFRATQKLFEELMEGDIQYRDLSEVLRDECEINLVIERNGDAPVDVDTMFRSMQLKLNGKRMNIR